MQKFSSLLVALCFFTSIVLSQSFTPGNIVVVRIGNGSASLTSAAQPVFLDEYSSLTGQLVQSKALPTSVSGNNRRLTLSGTATSEGALTLSGDGRFLCLAGYDTTTGTASVASASVGKVAAIVSANGNINTQTGITAGNGYNTNNVRGAVTNDGTAVWLSGAGSSNSGGTFYVPANSFTSSPVKISSSPTNTRTINIFGGQLYVSAASSGFYGVSQVGTGLPTTSGQTTSLLSGVNDSSNYAFVVFDADANEPGNDLIYVADDNTTKGGIIKYSKVGGVWLNNGKIASSRSLRGLALVNACGRVRGYVSSQDTIYTFTDVAGYNQTINATLVSTIIRQTNTVFRGIAFAPGTTNPTPPVASLGSSSPVKCFGGASGAASITASGGTGNLSYTWSDNGSGASRTNLTQGVYSVTVSDQLGCSTVVSNISITQPTALGANVAKTDVSCFGLSDGGIAVGATGGTTPYQFNWSSGNGSNLAAGVYSVTITDGNNCTLVRTDTVKQPALLVLNATKGNVTCGSTNNGFINLNPSGGNSGNSFLWNDNDVSASRTNLTAGNYSVTVTDSKGCTAERKDTILQTNNLSISGTVVPVSCFGGTDGSITVSAVGGSGTYTFSWSGIPNGQNVSALQAGTYSVTVDDGNNCTGSNSFTVTQPDSIIINGTVTNAACFGSKGAVALANTGGTGTLSAAWSGNANPASLNAGSYTVTVTDGNGCSKSKVFVITQPDSIALSGQVTNASSFGAADGAIVLTVSGGTPNYDFDWGNNIVTRDRSNIPAGSYTVTVTDDNNCTNTRTFVVSQPSSIGEIGEVIWVKNAGRNGNSLWFDVSLATAEDLRVSTVALSGAIVNEQLFKGVSKMLVSVGIEDFAEGVYIVHFEANGKLAKAKVVVSK